MTIDWQLPALRTSVVPTPDELLARRAGMSVVVPGDPVVGVEITKQDVGGVPCVICTPDQPRSSIVYFHGGGYRLGSAAGSTPFASRLAAATGARLVVVDYRLAPEHPFPAAVTDAVAAYGATIAEFGAAFVGGDSAGGGVAAALVVACIRAGAPLPVGLLMLSPWADLTVTASTYEQNADTDQLFSRRSAAEASGQYLQGHDTHDPLASPRFAEVGGFPPTLVLASTDEVLLADTLGLTDALASAGVQVRASFVPGAPHAWPALFPDLPETGRAVEDITTFVTRHRA